MANKLISSLIFAISAFLPIPIILTVIGLINGDISSGISFLIRHTEIFIPFLLVPAIVAFISAYLLLNRIQFKPEIKNNNRKSWIVTSLLIVLLSLFLWAFTVVFLFQSYDRWLGFKMAWMAGTIYSWAVFPPGLLAGYTIWRMKRSTYVTNTF